MLDRNYSFDDLIKLSLNHIPEFPYDRNNVGAIDFIMCGSPYQNDMVPEFIDFLNENLISSCSLSEENLRNLSLFFFLSDGKYIESKYIEILDKHLDWLKIKKFVLNLIQEKNLFFRH